MAEALPLVLLAEQFAKLPGIGMKTAQRLSYFVMSMSDEEVREFADDIEMLEDLVMSAVNECVKSIEETSEKEMSAVTGGVSLPGIL